MSERVRRLLEVCLVAALAAVAGMAFHRAVTRADVVMVAAVVAPTAVVCALGARWLRARLLPALAVNGGVCFVVVAGLLQWRTAGGIVPTATVLRGTAEGLTGGWREILAVTPPARATLGALAFVAGLVWVSAALAAETALRTRSPLTPAVPAVLSFSIAVAFGAGGPGSNGWLVAVLVGVMCLLAVIRSGAGLGVSKLALTETGSSGPPGRRFTLAIILTIAAATASLVAAHAAPLPHEPFDPRELRDDPVTQTGASNPLSAVRGLLTVDQSQVLFTVEAGAPLPPRWRLAALSHYDGRTWQLSPGSTFGPTGELLEPRAGATEASRYRVTIEDLAGPFLPVPDRPVSVYDESLLYDDDTETLIAPDGVARGKAYVVAAQGPSVPDAEMLLRDEPVVVPPVPGAATSECVDAFADAVATRSGESSPPGTMLAFERFLREGAGFVVDPERSVSGHSLGQMTRLIHSSLEASGVSATSRLGLACGLPRESVALPSNVGTSEHFASLFALMARAQGLEARVVVGFRSQPVAGSSTLSVTGGHTIAWPEVLFRRSGWVSFDPLPSEGKTSPAEGLILEGEAPARAPSRNTALPSSAPRETSPQEESTEGLAVWLRGAGAAVLAVAVLTLFAVVLLKTMRSRRRRSKTDSRERTVAAWEETMDRLVERGLVVPSSATATEVVALARRALGLEIAASLPELVGSVNCAAFSPAVVEGRAAERAWAVYDAVVTEMRRRETWLRRARAAISPKPFLRG